MNSDDLKILKSLDKPSRAKPESQQVTGHCTRCRRRATFGGRTLCNVCADYIGGYVAAGPAEPMRTRSNIGKLMFYAVAPDGTLGLIRATRYTDPAAAWDQADVLSRAERLRIVVKRQTKEGPLDVPRPEPRSERAGAERSR